jgi:hypothetical protein
LQNQRLEKQYAVKAFGPGIRFSFPFSCPINDRPKNLPINYFIDLSEWITGHIDAVKTYVKIEKSKLAHNVFECISGQD